MVWAAPSLGGDARGARRRGMSAGLLSVNRDNFFGEATPLIVPAERLSGRRIAAQCDGGERLITTQAGLVTAASFRI